MLGGLPEVRQVHFPLLEAAASAADEDIGLLYSPLAEGTEANGF